MALPAKSPIRADRVVSNGDFLISSKRPTYSPGLADGAVDSADSLDAALEAPPVHAPPPIAKPPRRPSTTDARKPPLRPEAKAKRPDVSGESGKTESTSATSSDELIVADDAERQERVVRSRDLTACIVSAIVHALTLVALAMFVIPIVTGQDAVTLLSTSFDENGKFEFLEPMEEAAAPEAVLEFDSDDAFEVEPTAPDVELPLPPTPVDEPEAPAAETSSSGVTVGATSEATTVESAVDGITGAILGQLEKGDLLVVWLFDASHSLVDDRERVADRLKPFFDRIEESRAEKSRHQLMNAVVSFGATTRERVPPTKFGPRIVGALKKLPVDESGKENVFASISQCAMSYRKKWKDKALMLVVWTDESGDDARRLEHTIEVCRINKAMVSVVGPSSVLGAQTGLHSYTDEKSKRRFLLPVDRGPDSAQPERLELGYWFAPQVPGFPGRTGLSLPSWYGGDDMKGVASGFSPYALTRLAAQTNGTYTIFDRLEDRGPFRIDTLRDYAPSYESAEAYDEMLRYHPLRKAVMQAVEVTQGEKLAAPETMLFVKRDRRDPTRFERPYMSPGQFASQLKIRKSTMKAKADRMSEAIEQALRHVSKGGDISKPLDELYAKEKSPRWKAWYDLTRGRLLATSVRLEEYRLALDAFTEPGYLGESTNHLILRASQNLRSSQEFQARGAEAERLLMRCLDQNADTPWAYLAQRELANGLGVGAQRVTLRLIRTRGPAARPGSPSLPKF